MPHRSSSVALDRLRPARNRFALVVPARWRTGALVLVALGVTAAVAATTAQNPHASPPDAAVALRVLILTSLFGAGIYAQTRRIQARMGAVLIATGIYAGLWLLNGSADRFLFSVGMLFSGLAPLVFAQLMLTHPAGRVHGDAERRLLTVLGGAIAGVWLLLVLTHKQPPVQTPLLRCAPNCPDNSLFIDVGIGSGVLDVLKVVLVAGWTGIVLGTAALMARRVRRLAPPRRSTMLPVVALAVANAACWAVYLIAGLTAPTADAYVACAAIIPLAILVGLGLERLSIGGALADFATRLAKHPEADTAVLMAETIGDPTLRIAYAREGRGLAVDAGGRQVDVPATADDRAVAWITRGRSPVAAIDYDGDLADEARFVEAAGNVALMHLENARLRANLLASTHEIAASRIRMVEAADTERQRIERDLHDGVQQQVIGMRLRLDLAAEAMAEQPDQSMRMMSVLGRQMDELLDSLRAFARGIYPSVLTDHGVADAVRSVGHRMPMHVSVAARGVGRYHQDVEVATYFCCVEALQNVAKHAGAGEAARVRISEQDGALHFEVSDNGAGFGPHDDALGHGLLNMRDRMEAVGGELTVVSAPDHGTTIRGSVPVA